MLNSGVKGRVVDEGNNPLKDLRVAAYDVEVLFDDVLLGDAMVDVETGDFSISYAPAEYGLEANPDIRLKIYDPVQRLVYESKVYEDVTDTILTISPDIVIHRADAEGWLVTGGTGMPQGFSTGNTVEPLIDSQKALWNLTTDFEKADGGSIRWLLHYHAIGTFTRFDEPPYNTNAGIAPATFEEGTPVTGRHLEDELLKANSLRGVAVWIVANDFPLPSPVDAVEDMDQYFKEKQPNTVQVQSFPVPLLTPMHAKVIVIDASKKRAYLAIGGGSQDYFDGPDHYIDDPRRGSIGLFNRLIGINVPIHDVYGYIEGPAVNDADEAVRLHWLASTPVYDAEEEPDRLRWLASIVPPDPIPPLPPAASPSPPEKDAVQIVRTLPKNRFADMPNFVRADGTKGYPFSEGETGILEAYQRAFRQATDFIYLENQYFTEQVIADSLLEALQIPEKPSLVAIILINIKVDVPGYDRWQEQLIEKLMADAKDKGVDKRIGVFSLWTHAKTEVSDGVFRHRMIRNYVHSKLAIVDDKWVTFGSANLEGTSLNRSNHLSHFPFGLAPPNLYNISRGSEVNAVIYNGVPMNPGLSGPALPTSDTPENVRRQLWAEHLGYKKLNDPPSDAFDPDHPFDLNHPDLTTKPDEPQGWLKLWEDRANEKLAALKLSPPSEHPARILRWVAGTNPIMNLEKLGITNFDRIVEKRYRSFDFDSGKWK